MSMDNTENSAAIESLKRDIAARNERIDEGTRDPNNYYLKAQSLVKLGDLTRDSQRYAQAIKALTEALKLSSEDVLILSYRSSLYARLGKNEEAVKDMLSINVLKQAGKIKDDILLDVHTNNILKDLVEIDKIKATITNLRANKELPEDFLVAFDSLNNITRVLSVTVGKHGERLDEHDSKIQIALSFINKVETAIGASATKLDISSFVKGIFEQQEELKGLKIEYEKIRERQDYVEERQDTIEKLLEPFIAKKEILESLVFKEEAFQELEREVLRIESDTYMSSFYHGLKRNLAGMYLAAQAISTGLIDSNNHGNIGNVGNIIKKAGEITPLVGVGVELLGSVLQAVGKNLETRKLKRLADIVDDCKDMSDFTEMLARKIMSSSLQIKIKEIKERDDAKHFLKKAVIHLLNTVSNIVASADSGYIIEEISKDDFSKITGEVIGMAVSKAEEHMTEVVSETLAARAAIVTIADKGKKHHILSSIKKFFGLGKKPQPTADDIKSDEGEQDAVLVSKVIIAMIYAGKLSNIKTTKIEDKVSELIRLMIDSELIEISENIADQVLTLVEQGSITDKKHFKWNKDEDLAERFKGMLAHSIQTSDPKVLSHLFNKVTIEDHDFVKHIAEQMSKFILDYNASTNLIIEMPSKPGHTKSIKSLNTKKLTQDVIGHISGSMYDITDSEVIAISHKIAQAVVEKMKHDDSYIIECYKNKKSLPQIQHYTWNTNQALESNLNEKLFDAIRSNKTLVYSAKMSIKFERKLVDNILHAAVDKDITKISGPLVPLVPGAQAVSSKIILELNDKFLDEDHFFDHILDESIKDITIMG